VAPIDYPAMQPHFVAAVPSFERVLCDVATYAADLARFAGPPPKPRWDQDWFPRLDAAVLYTLIRSGRPANVIELGSGHSTRFAAAAIADGGLDCSLVCIDPSPRATLQQLPIRWHRRLLSTEDADLVAALRSDDVLFVDSSHIAMPGTDVDIILNCLLPRLSAGVLVHFHDILLPDRYPETWAWRGYNEQEAVGPCVWSGAFDLMFASHFVVAHRPDLLADHPVAQLPLVPGAIESSLWLRRR
jgi:predicted O-methyltransferase YrrM